MSHDGTNYPRGGLGRGAGGDGIFLDPSGEPIRLWLDTRIRGARTIIKAAEEEGAEISSEYDEPETHLMILHPSSFRLFDGYCHPTWLPPRAKKRHEQQRAEGIEMEEEWKRKVMLKESWVDRCLKAGRFLGESDDWAGVRVGGPPIVKLDSEEGKAKAVATVDVQPDAVDEVAMNIDSGTAPDPIHGQMESGAEAENAGRPAAPVDAGSSAEAAKTTVADTIIAVQAPDAAPTEPADPAQAQRPPTDSRAAVTADIQQPGPSRDRSASPSQTRKKRKRDTDMVDELDISLLDSGPSSRFVSPPPVVAKNPAPPPPADDKIFRDLAFYVDVSTKNRTEILRDIKVAGGTIAVDYPDATHVLVQRYLANKDKWDPLVATYAPMGVWFVYVEWVKQSISQKARRPESAHCIPGAEQAAAIARPSAPEAEAEAEAGPGTRPGAQSGKELSATQMDTIITQESEAMAKKGLRVARTKGEYLAEKHGVYNAKQWKRIYRAWAARTDRFSHLPPRTAASAFETLEEAPLMLKQEAPRASLSSSKMARKSKEELDEIFEKEAWRFESEGSQGLASHLVNTYGAYTQGTWLIYFGNWRNARKSSSPTKTGLRSSVARTSQQPANTEPTPAASSSAPQYQNGRKLPTMTNSEIAAIYHGIYADPKTANMTNSSLGYYLNRKYPGYSNYTWENMVPTWKHGNGRFAAHGPRWDGQDTNAGADVQTTEPVTDDKLIMSEKHEDEDDGIGPPRREPVEPPAPRGWRPYTEEEYLAMGQFVAAVRDRGEEPGRWRTWEEFAAVYPHRTPGAWAQQYTSRRRKIDEIADRHQASTSTSGANSTADQATPSATASASQTPAPSVKREARSTSTPSGSSVASPAPGKGQKGKKRTPVSKEDYENLARFIAENVADGDVPTTADFEKFSAAHSHRKSNGWYSVWHRDKYRITLLPLIDRYRKERTAASSSTNSKEKPKPTAYTEEEERAMAEFIVKSVPSDRPPKASDWMLFQKKHTQRSAPAWTEHYRVYTDRIEAFATEIRGVTASQAGRRAPEVIELGSDEEEEEEVEGIVPLGQANADGIIVIN